MRNEIPRHNLINIIGLKQQQSEFYFFAQPMRL